MIIVLLIYLNSRSQNITGVENFLLASEQDQEMLVQEYFNPLFNALQISMGEGWVKSAKTHKKLGFDLALALNEEVKALITAIGCGVGESFNAEKIRYHKIG